MYLRQILILLTALLCFSCGKEVKNENSEKSNIVIDNDSTKLAHESLFIAIDSGDENLVTSELENGANPNAVQSGDTALVRAILRGKMSIVRILIENGANPSLADSHNHFPLDIAIENKAEDIFFYLTSKHALDIHPNKLSLLILAIKNNLEQVAIEIVIQQTDFDMNKALYYSNRRGLLKLNKFLQYINKKSKVSPTELVKIISGGHINHLRYYGKRSNLVDVLNGHNALVSALSIRNITGRYQTIEYLINHGITPSGLDRDLKNPVIEASKNKDLGALKILVNSGAQPHFLDAYNRSPLSYAVANLDSQMVEFLVASGALKTYPVKIRNRTYFYNVCSYLSYSRSSNPRQVEAFKLLEIILTCRN